MRKILATIGDQRGGLRLLYVVWYDPPSEGKVTCGVGTWSRVYDAPGRDGYLKLAERVHLGEQVVRDYKEVG